MQKQATNEKAKRAGVRFGSFFAVFAMIFLRYLYFGFTYYPQLDDYIQYHNYAAMGRLSEMISHLGLLAARPLAGILDIALWSKFWGNMVAALALLSMLYAASALVFYRLFEKIFGTGKLFLLFYTLLPLAMEGSYWISAATRLLPGLFFCSLSAYTFHAALTKRKVGWFLLSLGFQLLTFCFYEQTAVLSCGLYLLIAFLLRREAGRRWTAAFACLGIAAVYFAFCRLSGESALYGGRTSLILPTSAYYFQNFLPDLFSQLYAVFVRGGAAICKNGFARGVGVLLSTNGFWKAALYLAVCLLSFCLLIRNSCGGGKKRCAPQILCGILLAALPLAPFFILANPYFSLRGALPSLLGIALVLDGALRFGLRKDKIISLFAALCAFLFSVVTVSELADYRENFRADQAVVTQIAETEMQGEKIGIFGLKDTFLTAQNFFYHEHISGVTSSSWALTGAVRCAKEKVHEKVLYIPYDTAAEYLCKPWNYAEKQLAALDALFAYDALEDSLLPLSLVAEADGSYSLFAPDGSLYGRVVEKNQTARFFEK